MGFYAYYYAAKGLLAVGSCGLTGCFCGEGGEGFLDVGCEHGEEGFVGVDSCFDTGWGVKI